MQAQAPWTPLIVIAAAHVLLIFNAITLKMSVDGIASSFGVSSSMVKTTIIVYSLVVAALILPAAKLARAIGSRRSFRAMVALFGLAMGFMALSADATSMIAAQVAAGVATAALLPTLAILIAENYHGSQARQAVSWLGAAQAMGIVPALLVAGAVSTWLDWRLTFGLLVVISAGIFILGTTLRSVRRPGGVRIDLVGMSLVTASVVLIGSGCNNLLAWGGRALLAIAAGAILLKVFLMWSRRHIAAGGAPLIALEAISTAQQRGALFSMFMIGVLGSAVTFVLPLYIEVVQGRSSLYTAAAATPFALASFAAAVLVVRRRSRIRQRLLARWGFAAIAVGMGLLGATIRNDWSDVVVILGLIISGAGEGALATLLFDILVRGAAQESDDDVGTLCGTTSYLAAGIGTALAGALIVGVLAASARRHVMENPLIPADLRARIDSANVSFVSNDELRSVLATTGATSAAIAEAVRINTEARLDTLRICFLTFAGVAMLALVPAGALSDRASVGPTSN
jgi:MFS family permease